MDHIRACYTRECRFYKGQLVPTRIVWYWAEPGAQPGPDHTVFHSLRALQQCDNVDEPGEITTSWPVVTNGAPPHAGLDGLHYEGTAADYLGDGVPPPCVLEPGGALPTNVPCLIMPAEQVLGGSVKFWTTYTAIEAAVSCATNFWTTYTAHAGVLGGRVSVPLYTALGGVLGGRVAVPTYTARAGVLGSYATVGGFPVYTAHAGVLGSSVYEPGPHPFPLFTAIEGVAACPPRYASLRIALDLVAGDPVLFPPLPHRSPIAVALRLLGTRPRVPTGGGSIALSLRPLAHGLAVVGVRARLAVHVGVRARNPLPGVPATPVRVELQLRATPVEVETGIAILRAGVRIAATPVDVAVGGAPIGLRVETIGTPDAVALGGALVRFDMRVLGAPQDVFAGNARLGADLRLGGTPATVVAGGAPVRVELQPVGQASAVVAGGAPVRVEVRPVGTLIEIFGALAPVRTSIGTRARVTGFFGGAALLRCQLHMPEPPFQDLLAGLAGFWPCHEASNANRLDSSGNGNTFSGSGVLQVAGLIGNTARFSGTSILAHSGRLWSSGDFSVSAWFKLTTAGGNGFLVTQANIGGFLRVSGGTVLNTQFGSVATSKSGLLLLNNWRHGVAIYRAGTVELYVDGVYVASATGTAQTSASAFFNAGGWVAGTTAFPGNIQLIGAWNRALSGKPPAIGQPASGEIAQLYNVGLALDYPFPRPVALLRTRMRLVGVPPAVVAGNQLVRVDVHLASVPHAVGTPHAIARASLSLRTQPAAVRGGVARLKVELRPEAQPATVHAGYARLRLGAHVGATPHAVQLGRVPVRLALHWRTGAAAIHGPRLPIKLHERPLAVPRHVTAGGEVLRAHVRLKVRAIGVGAGKAKVRVSIRTPVPWYSLTYSPSFLTTDALWLRADAGTFVSPRSGFISSTIKRSGTATVTTGTAHGMSAGSVATITGSPIVPDGSYAILGPGSEFQFSFSLSGFDAGPTGSGLWRDDTPASLTGDQVGVWRDQSGNNNWLVQNVPTARPTLYLDQHNGLPGILFDGNSDFLTSVAGVNFAAPAYVFLVATGFYIADSIFFDANSGSGPFARLECCTPVPSARLNAGSPATAVVGPAASVFGLAEFVFDGSASTVSVNNLAPVTCDPGSGAPNGAFTLGAGFGGVHFGQIMVFELIVIPGTSLTPAIRSAIKNYLNDRWNIWTPVETG